MLYSILFYGGAVLLTIIMSAAAIVSALITRSSASPQKIARLWARMLLFMGRVRLEVEGREHLNPRRPYIFAANHQSQFDIFALLAAVPVPFSWLAKEELFRIPLLGPAMKGAGYIPINRTDRRAAFASIDQAAARVREGTSIVIFPEGTRSLDGKLKTFKKGGFFLAIKSRQPVVPVSISGSFRVLAKRSFRVHRGTIRVHFSAPVPTDTLSPGDKDRLIAEVRRIMEQHLPPEERGEAEAPPRPRKSE
ncbi:MAG TPA: lysophospholipid acyltransferase family protein [Syntrophobacteria bacterium]|nr:lysophospholipid acyltransferase family protein [Syntrophobacteria bacterium]